MVVTALHLLQVMLSGSAGLIVGVTVCGLLTGRPPSRRLRIPGFGVGLIALAVVIFVVTIVQASRTLMWSSIAVLFAGFDVEMIQMIEASRSVLPPGRRPPRLGETVAALALALNTLLLLAGTITPYPFPLFAAAMPTFVVGMGLWTRDGARPERDPAPPVPADRLPTWGTPPPEPPGAAPGRRTAEEPGPCRGEDTPPGPRST